MMEKCRLPQKMTCGKESATCLTSKKREQCTSSPSNIKQLEKEKLLNRIGNLSKRLQGSKQGLCGSLSSSQIQGPCAESDYCLPIEPEPPDAIFVEVNIPPLPECPKLRPCKIPCPSKCTPEIFDHFLCRTLLHRRIESCAQIVPDVPCRPRSSSPVNISEQGLVHVIKEPRLENIMTDECLEAGNDDVTIYIENHRFIVSRRILTHYSRYFKDVLGSINANAACHSRIVMGGIKVLAFQIVYKWMANCEKIPKNHLADVLFTAVKLDIPELVEECLQSVQIETGTSDLMDMYEIALTKGSKSLQDALRLLVTASFLQIARSGRFLVYEPERVQFLLQDDAIVIMREWEIFEAALRWLKYNWNERKAFVESLINCVRFGLMPEEHVLIAATDPRAAFVMHTEYAQAAVGRGLLYHMVKRQHLTSFFPQLVPHERIFLKVNSNLCFQTPAGHLPCNPFDEKFSVRKIFNIEERAAQRIQAHFRGVGIRNKLQQQINSAVRIQSWYRGTMSRRKLCYMMLMATKIAAYYRGYRVRRALKVLSEIGRKLHGSFGSGLIIDSCMPRTSLATHETTVLLMGGLDPHQSWNKDNVGREMLRYNPCADNWKTVGFLPEPMHHAAATWLDGLIYITGGCIPCKSNQGKTMLATTRAWCFHPVACEWARLPQLRHCRLHHNLVAACGKLYAIGGENRHHQLLSSVEWFDPKHGRAWQRGLPMIRPRMGAGAAEFRGRIWVCGGVGKSCGGRRKALSILSSVECFDYSQNCWMLQQNLPCPKCFTSLLIYSHTLHLVGGTTAEINEEYKSNNDNSKFHDSGEVLMLDPDMQQWHVHFCLNVPRHGACAVQVGRRLMVLAGISSAEQKSLAITEQFIGSTSIANSAPLPHPKAGACAVAIPPNDQILCP